MLYKSTEYGIEAMTQAEIDELEALQQAVTDTPPPVPQTVTPAQGLMALYALKNITEDDIYAAIDSISDPSQRYQATIAYKKATSWERASITMQTLAALLGLTEWDLDDLFTLASTFTNL